MDFTLGNLWAQEGYGPWPDVTISEARERAQTARRRVRDGVDPIEERALVKAKSKRLTVEEAILGCFQSGHSKVFLSSFVIFCSLKLTRC